MTLSEILAIFPDGTDTNTNKTNCQDGSVVNDNKIMSTLFERAQTYDATINRAYELIPYKLDEAETILEELYQNYSTGEVMKRLIERKLLGTLKFLESSNLDQPANSTSSTNSSSAVTKALETLQRFGNSYISNQLGLGGIKTIKSVKLRIFLYEKMTRDKYFYSTVYSQNDDKKLISYVLSSEPLEVFEHLATSMCPRISQPLESASANDATVLRHGYSSLSKPDEFFRLNKSFLCRAACANSDHRVLEYLYEKFYAPSPASGMLSLEEPIGDQCSTLIELVCSDLEHDHQHVTSSSALCITTFSPQVFLHLMKTNALFTVVKVAKRLEHHLQSKTLDSSIFLFKLFLLCPSLHREMQNDKCRVATSSVREPISSTSSATFIDDTGAEMKKDILKIGNYCEEFITSLRQLHPPASVLILEYFL